MKVFSLINFDVAYPFSLLDLFEMPYLLILVVVVVVIVVAWILRKKIKKNK